VLNAVTCNIEGFLWRDTCVSSTYPKRPIWNRAFSYLKILICRKYSFQKLTQFSQGYNVIDSNSCNTHGFLSRDISVSSTWLNRPTRSKQTTSTLKHLSCRKYTFQKLTQFSQGSNTDSFPQEIHLFHQLN
jgi:hypothetical protein